MTYDNNMKYTHNKYKLVNTENTNELILNVEVYKCYKNKSVNSCDNEVTDFKKQNIKIDEVEIRKTGISCGKYNQVVYKGKFGKNIYSYINGLQRTKKSDIPVRGAAFLVRNLVVTYNHQKQRQLPLVMRKRVYYNYL